jgi:hypothetical protein
MPALSVFVDGKHVATVCTDGLDSLSVDARGTLVDKEMSNLDVSGGNYPSGSDAMHLTWVTGVQLRAGQVVTVSLLESAASTLKGKTIDEMFPDEPQSAQTDFKPTARMYTEVRARPKFREKYGFQLESSLGTKFVGETEPGVHGFGFSVHWNSFHPERARVSLHSYSLESLEVRGPMSKHVEERIYFGDSVRFQLVA